ncbi:MAG: universal stress protein [Solirubrobacteraceae bacterium]
MKTIVVAYDASDSARAALERAADLTQALDAKLILVSVAPVMQGIARTGGIDPTDPPEQRAAELDEAQALVSGRGVQAESVVAVGHPDEGIIEVAKERDADLIVIGSRQVGMVARLLGQSVSEPVVRNAPCDVYVVHQK